ncbi:MAG: FAD-dependent oxidoreductase, partial [Acidobacteriota bacterium]|nr:FAD-dependent oxidoreductase [Acidobacteriota bacterium]
ATAGGVMTSISAAREGLKVALIEPGRHVGGMATGGLSRTDFGKKEVIGGLPLEFYWRIGLKYEIGRYGDDVAWYYEPHVAEQLLREMLAGAGVHLVLDHRLREQGGVQKDHATVVSITTEDGTVYRARAFADCSYEGDLMAQAHVSYTWGRESSAQYGESLGGVRGRTPLHQFLVPIRARDEHGRLLPEISPEQRGATGAADRKVQAYNFRMILSDDPANRIPFPQPAHYDPQRYELLARLLTAMQAKLGRAQVLHEVALIAPIPVHKADFNNQGAFSTDYIGGSWEYPEAGYARRAEIFQAHVEYTKGYFYFLAHDPRVPKSLQEEVNRWGLAADEFTDTGHWPNQLYIREARRMVGDFVMTQKDVQTDVTKPDPIGMGSYNSDSHNVQRFVNAQGDAENEGDMQVAVTPYQIPYRVLLPRRSEAVNLLVPVCFSASHVAYSSLRMEPQYMMIGQAAGVAAAMALRAGIPVQDVDTAELTARLRKAGVVMEYHAPAVAPGFFHQLFGRYLPGASGRAELP